MGKQWKSNLHLEENWLASVLECFAFTGNRLCSFISSNCIQWAWFIRLSMKTEGCFLEMEFVLNASQWWQTTNECFSQRPCSQPCINQSCFTELHQIKKKKKKAIGVLAQSCSACSFDTKYLHSATHAYATDEVLFLNIFLWEERTAPQKGVKSNNQMQYAEEKWFIHMPHSLFAARKSWD